MSTSGDFSSVLIHICPSCLQGYQVSLRSTQGPIDVFLCPEDSSSVCSPMMGSSPSKPQNADPTLPPPATPPADPPPARTSNNDTEGNLPSPASSSSTVTAASQQDPSSLVLGGNSGEFFTPVRKQIHTLWTCASKLVQKVSQ